MRFFIGLAALAVAAWLFTLLGLFLIVLFNGG